MRNKSITFLVTEIELANIKKGASKNFLSTATFVRLNALQRAKEVLLSNPNKVNSGEEAS